MPLITSSFAVRFVYGAGPTTLDFNEPATIVLIDPIPTVGRNIVVSGKAETLFGRLDHFVTLSWSGLSTAKTIEVANWWAGWAVEGKQTAITLDRLATAAGQIEYDLYNAFFTKGEVWGGPGNPQIPPILVRRQVLERAKYTVGPITFRQGQ